MSSLIAQHDPATGESVLANQGFLAARQRLGLSGNGESIAYMDLPKLAPRGYQMVLALQRSALGAADLFGLQTPALALPPLNKIMPHLDASIGATWVDDAGWHYRSTTPFPAADLLGGEQAAITTVAPVAMGIALPAFAQARQNARIVASLSNLRQVGLAIQLYANDHDGKLPPDLGSTYSYVGSAALFVAPEHLGTVALPTGNNAEKIALWVNANTDYVYVGAKYGKYSNVTNASQIVFAHEKFDLARDGRVDALFADGHAEVLPVPIVKQRIEDQTRDAGPPQGL